MCVDTIYKLDCLDFNLFSFGGVLPHLKKIFFNVYLFLRERERDRVEQQRETELQNLKQAPGFELSAESPSRGLNSRDHDLS